MFSEFYEKNVLPALCFHMFENPLLKFPFSKGTLKSHFVLSAWLEETSGSPYISSCFVFNTVLNIDYILMALMLWVTVVFGSPSCLGHFISVKLRRSDRMCHEFILRGSNNWHHMKPN